ncbi:MAG: hypothetical protein GY945_07100 [Rhodobacteraceae bacterium]|nr:hypothetical protein [Paracoccaceae bacterium]
MLEWLDGSAIGKLEVMFDLPGPDVEQPLVRSTLAKEAIGADAAKFRLVPLFHHYCKQDTFVAGQIARS